MPGNSQTLSVMAGLLSAVILGLSGNISGTHPTWYRVELTPYKFAYQNIF